jgi:hypothetical protein
MKKTFQYLIIIASIMCLQADCNTGDPPDNTDPRDKFVGNWTCNETSSLNKGKGSSSFTVTISLSTTNTSQINLANFYGMGTSKQVYAVVAGDNATIPDQSAGGFPSIKGSGSISSNNTKIDWSYYVNDGADIDTCTAVYNKQ